MSSVIDDPRHQRLSAEARKVIVASTIGTMFESYDFFLYGSLAGVLAKKYFAALDPSSSFVFALLAFAAGFIVRPIGALIFGRLGDVVGRKYAFMVTIIIMGLSTFLAGLIPDASTIGILAPIALIALRLLQGLAIGGEYGGAVTFVAEYAPRQRRGGYSAWLQTTATLGLLLSLIVIAGVRSVLGDAEFNAWGWRLPFLGSLLLLALSMWFRLQLTESPVFTRVKAAGRLSSAPLREAFVADRGNAARVLVAFFGLVAGQAVVWYAGQIYALFFLTRILKVSALDADVFVGASLLLGIPFFWVFGALADRFGRKRIILNGLALAALSYFPLYHALTAAANPALAKALVSAPVRLIAAPDECSFQFDPLETKTFTSSCDIAKRLLAEAAIDYTTTAGQGPARIVVGDRVLPVFEGGGLSPAERAAQAQALRAALARAAHAAGYPEQADPNAIDTPLVIGILFVLVLLVAMVYGPLAAALAELFPTRLRCTSLSLPYHLGNGWFGGLLPTIAFALVAQNGNIYYGLWYAVIVAAVTFVIGMNFLPETAGSDLNLDG